MKGDGKTRRQRKGGGVARTGTATAADHMNKNKRNNALQSERRAKAESASLIKKMIVNTTTASDAKRSAGDQVISASQFSSRKEKIAGLGFREQLRKEERLSLATHTRVGECH